MSENLLPRTRDETLKMLANLFSESVHETWTKEEIINIIEDVIKLGAVPVGSRDPRGVPND